MQSALRARHPSVAATAALLVLLTTSACAGSGQGNGDPQSTPPPDKSTSDNSTERQSAEQEAARRPPPPQSVRANELGEVPILMYHGITPEPESVYDRTPKDFRAELKRLAVEGYVPVTATEYATGRIDIPAGKHPVVLTFDDGSPGQFTLDERGRPRKGSAVDVLLDVAEEYPQFRPVATFYVFTNPFDDTGGKRTLTWLAEHGFEIGNHTMEHPNLSELSDSDVQDEIAGMQRIINSAVPDAPVRSLALPLGVHPENETLATKGSARGQKYQHNGVMLVGSNPAPSPWSAEFDPANIPRIRSQAPEGEESEYGSSAWLDKLAADTERRYTSDGDPKHISVPEHLGEDPNDRVGDRLRQY